MTTTLMTITLHSRYPNRMQSYPRMNINMMNLISVFALCWALLHQTCLGFPVTNAYSSETYFVCPAPFHFQVIKQLSQQVITIIEC